MKIKGLILATALAGIMAPVFADTAPYCIALNGGFGNGGASMVARNFEMPEASKCNPFQGYTKSNATVIFQTTGNACLSDDGLVMTVLATSADPNFTGYTPGSDVPVHQDYLRFCPAGAWSCAFGGGVDFGTFGPTAEQQDCTDTLLSLPAFHD
jgi:hypothetical protein